MSETVHDLIEQYGLIAVFLGCLAEGETPALIAGFFMHQGVFMPGRAILAVFAGAFGGDALFFLLGRRFADKPFVRRLRGRPGFDRAFGLIRRHPVLYVMGNRYAYGFRTVGGVAAGLSDIPAPLFLLLNAASAFVWTALFVSAGYVFGLGAEQLLGTTLHEHQRLALALGIGLAACACGWYVARRGKTRL